MFWGDLPTIGDGVLLDRSISIGLLIADIKFKQGILFSYSIGNILF